MYEALEEMLETNGGDDLLIASQPNWPFENHVAEIRVVEYVKDHPFEPSGTICLECGGAPEEEDHQMVHKVYIVEGDQIGYLPGEAKEELGW
jgi:hypothetical protein